MRRVSSIRRTMLAAVAVSLAALTGSALAAAPARAAQATFTPGAARTDQNGHALQMHGLGIIKVGSTWYAFGEDKTGESSGDAHFQDIPCYSSADLAHWTYQGAALARQSSGDLGPGRIIERPKVIYNSAAGQYVMYMHVDNSSYSEAKVGVATSSSVCGPYTYHGSFQPLGFQSRDIGLFEDTDGAAYLLSEDRANGLRIDRLSADYLSVTNAVAVLPDYEAPAMMKIAGTYYIFGSHLTGWSANDNVYATATSLSGPWSSASTFAPARTSTYQTQTANIITVQGSAGTTYVYAGDRWTTSDLGASPLIWLPLTIHGTTATMGWYDQWSLDTSAGTWSASASLPPSGPHVLTNQNSGMAMDIAGASRAGGALVIQWPANGGANQEWALQPVTGNVFTVHNVNSGMCLDVPGSSGAQGVQLDQQACNGGASQEWALEAVGNYQSASDTDFVLASASSGMPAEVKGNSTTSHAQVDQWPSNGGSNQVWSIG
jgi:Glycosyl hydrolases family 43/Ricin-type beta-trefoil lectin domain-like